MTIEHISGKAWMAKGRELFGDDTMGWLFACPVCHHVAAVRDWKEAGAPEATWAFSCIGRYLDEARDAFEGKGPGPCSYAGGGFFRLNPVHVDWGDSGVREVFAFADESNAAREGGV